MIDAINKHIENGKAVHIKKAIEPFSWDVVVKHLQQCADGDYAGTPNGILSYQLNQAEEVEDVKRVMDYLNEGLSLKIFDAHIFPTFIKKTGAVHSDNHNVVIWSITGNMVVNLFDEDSDEPFYTDSFDKGDIFYIPADVKHSIDSTGARALVSFGIEVAPDVKYNSEITNPYVKIKKEEE
jgi:mannose-6-phosphate isomerase-like protein (cupin superfamily)